MIKKLFGETEEEQYRYLKPRLTALGVGVGALLIGLILMQFSESLGSSIGGIGEGICVIVALIFGWSIMRGFFGYATVGALFSGNVVIGVVIFVVYVLIGYLGGFVVAFIGLCRFFVLLKKRKGNG